jgi:two-component system nitrogen regulation response regulator GlnG
MTLENALLFALAEASDAGPGERADVVPLRPRHVRELLSVAASLPKAPAAPPASDRDDDEHEPSPSAPAPPPDPRRFEVFVAPQQTLNDLSQSFERQVYTELFRREAGSFAKMAGVLTGSEEHARRVQLRFNQLGLRVRELKASP